MNRYADDVLIRAMDGLVTLILLSAISFSATVGAADVKGSKDHPMISRYEGSEIISYKQEAFNESALFTRKVNHPGGVEKNAESTLVLEGRVTAITYRAPPERTTLEVLRNYESALTDAGFEILFSCKGNACGGYNFNRAVTNNTNLIGSQGDQRYLSARLARDSGDVYVSLYVATANVGGGPDYRRVLSQLHVIEIEPMQGNMVLVDADAMAKGIGEEGRIALYGILFDYDSAKIKPGSKPTLEQIAALMNANPELELVIVGHTDNQGGLEYNMNLSKRRAKAVEETLVRDYGIVGKRLSAWGVGYLSPVASNRSEEGRALNRRVELVER